jgi:tetratricopeptide (TPR) repeat protein
MPVVGKDAINGWLAGQDSKLRGEPLLADVSRSGDLGYAYGHYELGGANPQAGYFARVWKRDESGRWRIVMDTISPLPAGARPLTAELLKAEDHYAARQWDEAVAIYQQYLRQDPAHAFAWHRLGTIQIQQGRYPDAIGNLERAIDIGGGIPADFYNLACAYAMSGSTDKALDNVERAIQAGLRNRQQYESDGDLASLRESARFKALMQTLQ